MPDSIYFDREGGSATVIATGFYTFTQQRAEGEWRIAKVFVGLDNAA